MMTIKHDDIYEYLKKRTGSKYLADDILNYVYDYNKNLIKEQEQKNSEIDKYLHNMFVSFFKDNYMYGIKRYITEILQCERPQYHKENISYIITNVHQLKQKLQKYLSVISLEYYGNILDRLHRIQEETLKIPIDRSLFRQFCYDIEYYVECDVQNYPFIYRTECTYTKHNDTHINFFKLYQLYKCFVYIGEHYERYVKEVNGYICE